MGDCVNSAHKFINADNLLQMLLTLLRHLKHTQAQEVGSTTHKASVIKINFKNPNNDIKPLSLFKNIIQCSEHSNIVLANILLF